MGVITVLVVALLLASVIGGNCSKSQKFTDLSQPFAAQHKSVVSSDGFSVVHQKTGERQLTRPSKPAAPLGDDNFLKFVPQFKASLKSNWPQQKWSTSCYGTVAGSIELGASTANVKITASRPDHLLCSDAILLIDREDFYLHFLYEPEYLGDPLFKGPCLLSPGQVNQGNKVAMKGLSATEVADISQHGLRVFYLPDGLLGSLDDVIYTLALFIGPWQETEGRRLVQDHFNTTFTKRTNNFIQLDEKSIQNGDYLAVRTWYGADPFIMVGTGSQTGHAATTLRIDGELFVVESAGHKPYWPGPFGVMKTPFADWMKTAYEANTEVLVFHLAPEVARQFDADAAVKFFQSVEGLPYGYHNFVFGWIDTVADNYPPPLNHKILVYAVILLEKLDATFANSLIEMGLNMRLGTQNLTMLEILDVCQAKNISFSKLLTIPEQDSWIYPDGKSMVCDVFVLQVYRAAGILGPVGSQIQTTEFHPRDSYSLNLYDFDNPLCTPDKGQPYCQVMGNYLLELPGANQLELYPHMNEQCGAMPPLYVRGPAGC